MLKKLLISFILALLVFGAFGFYSALKYRQSLNQTHQPVKTPDVTVTFLEGWNNKQIGSYLENKSITKLADFLAVERSFNASDYPILSGLPKSADLEGFIFPDTYFIPGVAPSGTDISQIIITKALDNFTARFTPQMQAQGAAADNMDVYQIVTLASIIEKETGHSQTDRQIVAGIFYNRLKAGMPLQSDATVSFFTGRSPVSPGDINTDSPYNTYMYKGLPRGPICNPSLSSIMAALYPTPSNYFYFLTDPKTGQVHYAVTYEQHLQNKAKYLQ
jgi:UPF0755 protein